MIMAIKKAPVKAKAVSTVTVETKKIASESDVCCAGKAHCSAKHMIKIGMMVLTVLNTILLISILANQDNAEALKVGGSDNYKMLKQIFVSEGYKAQQKQQIEQALQMFANPESAAQLQQNAQGATQQPAAQQQAAQPAQ